MSKSTYSMVKRIFLYTLESAACYSTVENNAIDLLQYSELEKITSNKLLPVMMEVFCRTDSQWKQSNYKNYLVSHNTYHLILVIGCSSFVYCKVTFAYFLQVKSGFVWIDDVMVSACNMYYAVLILPL